MTTNPSSLPDPLEPEDKDTLEPEEGEEVVKIEKPVDKAPQASRNTGTFTTADLGQDGVTSG